MRVAEVGAVAVEEAEERLPTPVQPKCEPLEHLKHSAVIRCLSFHSPLGAVAGGGGGGGRAGTSQVDGVGGSGGRPVALCCGG